MLVWMENTRICRYRQSGSHEGPVSDFNLVHVQTAGVIGRVRLFQWVPEGAAGLLQLGGVVKAGLVVAGVDGANGRAAVTSLAVVPLSSAFGPLGGEGPVHSHELETSPTTNHQSTDRRSLTELLPCEYLQSRSAGTFQIPSRDSVSERLARLLNCSSR